MAAAEEQTRLQIGHVLFIDIVGYSKLLVNQQSELLRELNEVVSSTNEFREAEAEGKLIRLPTGDGMALVFRTNPEAAAQCALEIARTLKEHPRIALRMGIHSGPVNEVVDVNQRQNIAGAGINVAQRVMDCGDAGHILVSKHVAEDLEQHDRWRPFLHDIGTFEVKHGVRVSVVNLYDDQFGNATLPRKIETVQKRRTRVRWTATLLALAAVITGVVMFSRYGVRLTLAAPEKSIAVLPFENASNDPNTEYLSEGISEALINSLTEVKQLRVIARSTAFHYKGKDVDPKQVGRELKVAAVLTGKVRQMQDALSVQVDLVDATTGAQLWGSAFDRKISDVIAVKQAIAHEVTDKLKLKLSGEEQRRLVKRDTTNPEAYRFYLRGRYLWNRRTPETIKQAAEQFQQAIERDPSFALGYAGLTDSYLLLEQYAGVPWSEIMPKARAAADKALQIDESLAEAHASSGLVYQFNWQWGQAEQEFRRAITLNPNYPTAHQWFCLYLSVTQQFDDALREIKRAQELDPLSPIISANVAIVLLLKNDIDAAIEQCQRIIEFDPNHPSGYDWLSQAYLKQRRYPEAIAVREKVVAMSQRSSPQVALLGYLYAIVGRRSEALKILKEVEEKYSRGQAIGQGPASIYDALDEHDQAFVWLEKDFQRHSAELQFIMIRPQFDHLRGDPRVADLIRRMGLNP